jgi:hypothetical protein
VTSLSAAQATPAMLLSLWRDRWSIENRTFWVRDVVFGEDRSRIRTGRAPENMSLVKNAALNFLRASKVPNIAAALRKNAVQLAPLLAKLHLPTF